MPHWYTATTPRYGACYWNVFTIHNVHAGGGKHNELHSPRYSEGVEFTPLWRTKTASQTHISHALIAILTLLYLTLLR